MRRVHSQHVSELLHRLILLVHLVREEVGVIFSGVAVVWIHIYRSPKHHFRDGLGVFGLAAIREQSVVIQRPDVSRVRGD